MAESLSWIILDKSSNSWAPPGTLFLIELSDFEFFGIIKTFQNLFEFANPRLFAVIFLISDCRRAFLSRFPTDDGV